MRASETVNLIHLAESTRYLRKFRPPCAFHTEEPAAGSIALACISTRIAGIEKNGRNILTYRYLYRFTEIPRACRYNWMKTTIWLSLAKIDRLLDGIVICAHKEGVGEELERRHACRGTLESLSPSRPSLHPRTFSPALLFYLSVSLSVCRSFSGLILLSLGAHREEM